MNRSKVPLACFWHTERFYIAGPVAWNGAGCLADRKPWVSMPFSQNGFTMLTHVTFLAFKLAINVPLTLLTSWLLILYSQNMLCIIA